MPGISHLFSRIQTTKHAHLLGSFQRASAQCKALPTGGNAICKSFTPTMQPVERMQQPSTFDLWLRRLWRLWHGTNASYACAEHCCLLIWQLIQFSTTPEWPGKLEEVASWILKVHNETPLKSIIFGDSGMLPRNFLHLWAHPWTHHYTPWNWHGPMEKEMEMNSETIIFRGKLLREANFSDVFRSCLKDLGPASEVFGKRCATSTSILYRASRPLHRSMSAVKIFVFHLQSWQKAMLDWSVGGDGS